MPLLVVLSRPPEAVAAHQVEGWLSTLLGESCSDPLIEEAVRLIHASRGGLPIQRLAGLLGIGRRQLARRFRAAIGIPPKAYSRITRFQEAVRCARKGRNWTEVAHECAYHDQAHLIHEFADCSQATPSSFIRGASRTPLTRFFNARGRERLAANTFYLQTPGEPSASRSSRNGTLVVNPGEAATRPM